MERWRDEWRNGRNGTKGNGTQFNIKLEGRNLQTCLALFLCLLLKKNKPTKHMVSPEIQNQYIYISCVHLLYATHMLILILIYPEKIS